MVTCFNRLSSNILGLDFLRFGSILYPMFKTSPLARFRRWLEHWHIWPFKYISTAVYWLRTHTYNKYHLVDCRNKRNGYEWGYTDISEKVLLANMALLNYFIDKEKGLNCHVDWRSAEEHQKAGEEVDEGSAHIYDDHAKAAQEMRAIYHWWNVERKQEHDAYDKALEEAYPDPFKFAPSATHPGMFELKNSHISKELHQKLWDMEKALDDKDEEMLIRFIKIRGYLWT